MIHETLQRAIDWIAAHPPRNVAVLTGAGISAESGIPTFRGADGLWKNFRAEDLATPQAFQRDPALVWEWYEWRRTLIREARPNAAHDAIARLGASDAVSVTVVTQNVDGLHREAGSDPLELHGNIFKVRCVGGCGSSDARAPFSDLPPRCDCGALLRPGVVWFGEALPPHIWEAAVDAVTTADLVLVVGTSGIVYPAAGLVGFQRHGISVEVNPQAAGGCTLSIPMPAGEAVPRLVAAIEEAVR